MATSTMPPDGAWHGYFQYHGETKRHPMRLRLAFGEDGAVTGTVHDADGEATLEGVYDPATGAMRWLKSYTGHATVVHYQGFWQPKRGVVLGRWRVLDDTTRGTFGLAPGKKVKGVDRFADEGLSARSTRDDLRRIQFVGDWQMREQLLADRVFQRILRQGRRATDPLGQRRDLIVRGLRLNARNAPSVVALAEKCRARLGLARSVEVYAFQSGSLSAMMVAVDPDRVVVGCSGTLLDRFDDGELAFVLGHELGHAAFEHDALPAGLLDEVEDPGLAPLTVMRFYAWMRAAEMSADRAGLLCCEDVETATRSFLKLASGLDGIRVRLRADDVMDPAQVVDDEWIPGEQGDWFDTHPFVPLRIRALTLFARSRTFHALLGRKGGSLSEAALDRETAALLALMEPSFLHEQGPWTREVREFVAVGSLLVALADGRIVRSERKLLEPLFERLRALGGLQDAMAHTPSALRRRAAVLGDKLAVRLSPLRRLQLLEDLVAVARADRRITEGEEAVLEDMANALGVHPANVAAALEIPDRAMD